MSFLNNTGLTYLFTKIMDYLTGSHVSTSVISGATTVDEALTKLQTKAGIATLTTTAKNLSGAVNELNSGLSSQGQQIGNLGPYNGLDSNSTTAALSAAQGKVLNDRITDLDSQNAKLLGSTRIKVLAPGYITGSGNYFDFFMPASIDENKTYSITDIDDATFYDNSGKYYYEFTTGEVLRKDYNGLTIELHFKSSQTPNKLLLLDTYLTFNVQ